MAICNVSDVVDGQVTPSSASTTRSRFVAGSGGEDDKLDGYITIEESAVNPVNQAHTFDIYAYAFGGKAPYGYTVSADVNGESKTVTCDG
jgi:peptidoglycan hydrolase-like protein with peptidoglycan-binding domain